MKAVVIKLPPAEALKRPNGPASEHDVAVALEGRGEFLLAYPALKSYLVERLAKAGEANDPDAAQMAVDRLADAELYRQQQLLGGPSAHRQVFSLNPSEAEAVANILGTQPDSVMTPACLRMAELLCRTMASGWRDVYVDQVAPSLAQPAAL